MLSGIFIKRSPKKKKERRKKRKEKNHYTGKGGQEIDRVGERAHVGVWETIEKGGNTTSTRHSVLENIAAIIVRACVCACVYVHSGNVKLLSSLFKF